MNFEKFRRRMDAGKSVSYIYERDGLEGMINVWKHGEQFVLTWEECVKGGQYDEHEYTIDATQTFATIDEVINYLEQKGVPIERFRP